MSLEVVILSFFFFFLYTELNTELNQAAHCNLTATSHAVYTASGNVRWRAQFWPAVVRNFDECI
jgi:hypothetical protein